MKYLFDLLPPTFSEKNSVAVKVSTITPIPTFPLIGGRGIKKRCSGDCFPPPARGRCSEDCFPLPARGRVRVGDNR
jgi:hypothetical protein